MPAIFGGPDTSLFGRLVRDSELAELTVVLLQKDHFAIPVCYVYYLILASLSLMYSLGCGSPITASYPYH